MKLVLIGTGAIAAYARTQLEARGHSIAAYITRPERAGEMFEGRPCFGAIADLPKDVDHVIDCAGHAALRGYGADTLRAGFDLTTVSIGALADDALLAQLKAAALDGDARLYLASGAIGALDAIRSASAGDLRTVRYVGRKPPKGWAGSPAENSLDLDSLTAEAIHFDGSAREAALQYPKNANVAAAVALAGLGFDDTTVTLIADPAVSANIHEIHAEGDFGSFTFTILGKTLPGNPRTSALAAMSVVAAVDGLASPVRF